MLRIACSLAILCTRPLFSTYSYNLLENTDHSLKLQLKSDRTEVIFEVLPTDQRLFHDPLSILRDMSMERIPAGLTLNKGTGLVVNGAKLDASWLELTHLPELAKLAEALSLRLNMSVLQAFAFLGRFGQPDSVVLYGMTEFDQDSAIYSINFKSHMPGVGWIDCWKVLCRVKSGDHSWYRPEYSRDLGSVFGLQTYELPADLECFEVRIGEHCQVLDAPLPLEYQTISGIEGLLRKHILDKRVELWEKRGAGILPKYELYANLSLTEALDTHVILDFLEVASRIPEMRDQSAQHQMQFLRIMLEPHKVDDFTLDTYETENGVTFAINYIVSEESEFPIAKLRFTCTSQDPNWPQRVRPLGGPFAMPTSMLGILQTLEDCTFTPTAFEFGVHQYVFETIPEIHLADLVVCMHGLLCKYMCARAEQMFSEHAGTGKLAPVHTLYSEADLNEAFKSLSKSKVANGLDP